MEKLRIGIIGAGGISGAHLPRLKERSDAVELVAIADVNQEAAAKVASENGIAQSFGDWREVLPLVDAVLICVPTFLHAEIASTALRAGKAVFCEKPLARTLEQAQQMQSAVEESGSPLQIGLVRRFDAGWGTWREAVLAGKIGRPIVWRDVQAHSGPPSFWFNQEELGGGPFLDGCIHNIDFALHTFGPAQWAFCHGRTIREGSTAIDTGTATVRFESGDEMMVAWSWGLPVNCSGGHMFGFFGSKGAITAGESTEDGCSFVVNDGENQEILPYPPDSITQAFAAQMDEFIEVARRQKAPRAGIAEGMESLKLALAILESGRSGQVVTL